MSEKELVLVEQFMRLHWLIPRYVHQCHKTSDPFVNSYSGQGRVLRLMQRKQKATQKELAEILGMRSQSLGELLGKLEKKGYILRSQSKTDKRVVEITLTELGKTARLEENNGDCNYEIFSCFSEEEQEQLHDYFSRMINHLEQLCSAGQVDSVGQARTRRSGRHTEWGEHMHGHIHEHMHDMLHTFNKDELSRQYQASSEITNGMQYFSDIESEVSSGEQTLENEYCNGCSNHCPLSQPRCKRGVMMQQKFLRK